MNGLVDVNGQSQDARRPGRRRVGRILVGLSVVWALVLGPAPAGADERATGFVALARAQGGRFTFGSPAFLIVEDYIDGGGPVAQAVLDSTGSSKAFGSLPYPGETAIAAPGTLAGLGVPKLPEWPFYAGAEHPATPESEVKDPSGQYALRASADEKNAAGFAQSMFGNDNGSGGGRSEVSVRVADNGTVTAVAENIEEMLSLGGGMLQINSVRSRSVTTFEPGSDPVTETALSVTGATVNGQGVVFTSKGMELAGNAVPGSGPESAAPLAEALRQQGITVEMLKSAPVKGGGGANVLRVTVLGGPPIEGTPRGRTIFDLGGATTSVVSGTALAAEQPAEEPAATASSAARVAAAPVARNTAGSGVGAPLSGGARGWGPGRGGEAARDTAPRAEPVVAELASAFQTLAQRRALGNGVGVCFALAVLGGVVLLGASHLWRKRGVRTPWTF